MTGTAAEEPEEPMTATTATAPLSDDDRKWLSRWTVGGQPGMEWLAGNPGTDRVRATLVKMLDRAGPATVFARVLGEHLGVDPLLDTLHEAGRNVRVISLAEPSAVIQWWDTMPGKGRSSR
jgi:hypothetical protein